MSLGTLQSDNGDVHENVPEKQTLHPFKPFCDFSQGIYVGAEERRPRPSSDRDRGIYRLVVPSSKQIWTLHVVIVQGRQKQRTRSVMHVQSCCFAN